MERFPSLEKFEFGSKSNILSQLKNMLAEIWQAIISTAETLLVVEVEWFL